MKAIMARAYGSPAVLTYEDVAKPVPGEGQVLVRVRAASVNPLDRVFEGKSLVVRLMAGLPRPKDPRLGRDVAGEIEAVGPKVTRFKPGDAVFGGCPGAFAEYACPREASLAAKPVGVSYEQAAAVPVAAVTALQALRDHGHLQPGQKVLINGAAGGVGTFAVQIAKAFGGEVTGITSPQHAPQTRQIGADRVIDYSQSDFTQSPDRYDLLVDIAGKHPLAAYRRVLTPKGRCVIVGGPTSLEGLLMVMLRTAVLSRLSGQHFGMFIAELNAADLTTVGELMAAGKVTPMIERRYPLDQVPAALRYLAEGHAGGKIVITV